MYDPIAYRKRLLARLLQIAGAGSAVAALSAEGCSARSSLGVSTTAQSASSSSSSSSGIGGAGGALSASSSTGGIGGFGGDCTLAPSGVSAATVGVGGAFPDGGDSIKGTACVDPGANGCVCASQAYSVLDEVLSGRCLLQTPIGPILEGGACCYEVQISQFPCYVGRTFFVDEGIVKAELRRGGTWRTGHVPDVSRVPEATRRALGEAWARDGLFEHASVASFSRFSMQLLALGAPADLVRDTHAAAVDEVRHAELCLALASAYLGENVEPAALPIPAPIAIEPDLAAIAAEVVMEGCIGETVATAQALDALAVATDPAVREVLEETVRDETRHAELGWRFVAWAIDRGGDPVREAVLRAYAGFRPPDARVEALDDVDLALYAAHGRQRAREGRAIAEETLARIVQPAMCVLLSRRPRPAALVEIAAAA
jgi:hypothetical protein